eukprot:scaffold4137_cov93-Isochrysis_galbana.AAC.1
MGEFSFCCRVPNLFLSGESELSSAPNGNASFGSLQRNELPPLPPFLDPTTRSLAQQTHAIAGSRGSILIVGFRFRLAVPSLGEADADVQG